MDNRVYWILVNRNGLILPFIPDASYFVLTLLNKRNIINSCYSYHIQS